LTRLNSLDGKAGGRSGSYIYRTFDKSFIVKTITPEEKLVLLNSLLEAYTERILCRNSLLVRVLGVFMLQSVGNYSINLLVMENISAPELSPKFKFDLKGSTLHRRDKKLKQPRYDTVMYKDLDFLDRISSFQLEESDRRRFLEGVEADVLMLARHGIMDYSVFGVYYEEEAPLNNKYCYRKKDSSGFYTLGLIDILQPYDSHKRWEHWAKRVLYKAEATSISSIEPQAYASRLMKLCRRL
jgi:hypothetical protein